MIKKLMFLLVLVISVLSLSSVVSATVDINDTATSNQIQKQINDADLGDEILFTPDATYNDISLLISKSATIDGRGATLIADGTNPIFAIAGSDARIFQNIVIRNFTLIGHDAITVRGGTNITLADLNLIGVTSAYYAIDARNGVNGFTVNNLVITGFRDALVIGGGDNIVVSNCYFHNNERNGISLFNSVNNANITNNNLTTSSYGIYFGGGVKDVLISGNTITHMACEALALVRSANGVIIFNNTIRFNQIGVIIKGSSGNNPFDPDFLNNTILDRNTITDNYLIGVFLQNLPENIIGTNILTITDTNRITNNGLGYKTDYYDKQEGSYWEREIGDSLNILKSYYKDVSTGNNNNQSTEPQIVYIEVEKPVTVTVEKPVTVEKQLAKDVVIIPTIKVSKAKIKKGKTVSVSVRLKNFGKDRSNILKVYNKYTKKTLTSIINGNGAKTLKFNVKINKKGINKIPIYLNGKLIATVSVRGL